MNPIRHAVPASTLAIISGRSREALLARAAVFSVVLLGAISCADSRVTEPLVQVQIPSGVAPAEMKRRPQQPAFSRAPLASMSAAAADAGDYTVESIAFSPEPGPFANRLSQGDFDSIDDATWGGSSGFDFGFDFKFFGTSYNKFWIGSNGAVMFQPAAWGACCYRSIPADDDVNGLIALALSDLLPSDNQISWAIRGSAPNRRLVVNFDQVQVFSGMGSVTTQAILYEGSNVIEIHTTSQDAAQEYTQGLENESGSRAAYLSSGRLLSVYGLANDAVRFTPVVQNEPPVVVENKPPVADAGGNAGSAPKHYEGIEGVAVEFKGSGADADNDALSYSWDFDNDGVADANSAEASFTYADNGSHSALLTVSDGRGGVAEARVDVVIRNVNPVVDAGSDVRVNAGAVVSFSGQFSDKGVNDALWSWTRDLGSLGSYSDKTDNQAAAILGSKRFCKAGRFPVKLSVVDKDGGVGSDELVVTVDALPVQIDVDPTVINLNDNGHGMISVRIYSRDGLDATALRPDAIRLTNGSGSGTPLARSGNGSHWNASVDLNGDGHLDVSAGFRRDELIANGDLTPETAELSLSGEVGSCGDVLGKAPVRVQSKRGR